MIAPEIVRLTSELMRLDQHITIETAGTVHAPVECSLMSISPKLANSTPWERENGRWAKQHERLRIHLEVLRQLTDGYLHQVKFVVSSPEDIREVLLLVEKLKVHPSRVVLMPEGTELPILQERAQWLGEICKKEGFRFSPRLHIEMYGNRRGM